MTLKLAFIESGAISGTPYCRWHYRLSWDTPEAPVPDHYVVKPGDTLWAIAGRLLGNPRRWPEIWRLNKRLITNPDVIFPGQSLAIPGGVGLESEVALGFDSRIDIRDPGAPDKVLLSGHQKPPGSRLQFVTATLPTAPGTTAIDFFFAAPCAVDPSTHVSVFTSAGGSVGWQDLTFDTESGLPTLQGPAVAATTVPGPSSHTGTSGGASDDGTPTNHGGGAGSTGTDRVPLANFRGVLPYSSELFGVYQPLLGWRSALSQTRLSNATAQRFNTATRLLTGAADFTATKPMVSLEGPHAVDRTGTSIGQNLISHISKLGSNAIDTHEFSSLFGDSEGSALAAETQTVIRRLQLHDLDPPPSEPPEHPTASPLVAIRSAGSPTSALAVEHEAATATLLHFLGEAAPDVTRQLFRPTPAAWQRPLAGAIWFTDNHPAKTAFLSPIGILHRFREYFFELGSFLGPPVGHVWLSPGGTVELVEVNTRRTLVERTVEQSTETVQKTELSQTDKDELSDAIKTENANDTKLGITAQASGGVTGVWQASGTASFNLGVSRKDAQEQTHKRMREQSSKLSSEVRQNYKTTFRTVTETTDTSSRRYVLQNTTSRLVSYELSRKMRKVAVQVQDLGQQLCWQLYVDVPGNRLGLGEFVHETMVLTDPNSKPPDEPPPPPPIPKTFSSSVQFIDTTSHDSNPDVPYSPEEGRPDRGINTPVTGHASIIQFEFSFDAPAPPPNYVLAKIESISFKGEAAATTDGIPGPNPDPATNRFVFRLTKAHFHNQPSISFDVVLIYMPTQAAIDKVNKAAADAKTAYTDELAQKREQNFYQALRARLKLVGKVRSRPQDDLREEERSIIYRSIITHLYGNEAHWDDNDYHVASELIRYLFDIDSMLYFVAPDWWRPRQQSLVSKNSTGEIQPTIISNPPIGSYRPDYLITEESEPAPQGASLGWLIQLDGDAHRNAFLNSPWVKAVLPIRPGRERDAIAWLRRPEVAGTDGLEELYPFNADQDPPEYKGLTMEGVLLKIADSIAEEQRASLIPIPVGADSVNPEVALPAETVFSHGFDPLEGGIKFATDPKDAFKVFSQWIEVLPTDQVVATEYDLTGLKG